MNAKTEDELVILTWKTDKATMHMVDTRIGWMELLAILSCAICNDRDNEITINVKEREKAHG